MLSRWIHIAAVRSYQPQPTQPAPKGLLPDRSHFTDRIVYEKTANNLPLARKETYKDTLAQQCRQRYEALRSKALASLITCYWLIFRRGSARMGREPYGSSPERRNGVDTRICDAAAFERSVMLAEETTADLLLHSEANMISARIEEQYGADSTTGIGLDNPRFIHFLSTFPKRWAARTNCRARYMIPNCKQYKGMLAPEAQLP